MISRLQDFVIRISRTWWLYLIVVVLFIGSLQVLMRIGASFPEAAAGVRPFDLQNELTPAEVYPQVAGYTDRARALYYAFTLVDYAFPFFAGLFIAATIAFALRNSLPTWYEAMVTRTLLPVFMIGTAFDWLENIAAITTIDLYPTEIAWLPGLLVLAKKLKLACVLASIVIMGLLLAFAAGRWAVRKARGAETRRGR